MKRNKPVIIAIGALLLLTAAAAVIHLSGRVSVPENALRVEFDGRAAELALEKLTPREVHGVTVNGKGEERAVDGQGVPLSEVLALAGVTRYTRVTVAADDEYSAVVAAEEIDAWDQVFLLLKEGERPQLVVFGDPNSKRNVSGVVRLMVE